MSFNIQSLNSKFDALKQLIQKLDSDKICIDVIAIQETWDILYPDQIQIPGYQLFIFKKRVGMRGGGVGFYIKNGINFKILNDCSPFENKIIESLTLQLTYPNSKTILVTNIYRSNGVLRNVTQGEQMNRFLSSFDDLLLKLAGKRHESYIFTDSNIDLLKIENNATVQAYLDSIFSQGFLQFNFKATRIQGNAHSLIDHIMSNTTSTTVETCVLVTISDRYQ